MRNASHRSSMGLPLRSSDSILVANILAIKRLPVHESILQPQQTWCTSSRDRECGSMQY